jgi:isopenicillin N synthase-like dioxygenase
MQIARIDLSLPEEEAAGRVREACIREGFFYIVNHGVDPELIQRMFDVNKAFFALPMEEKRKIHVNSAFKCAPLLHLAFAWLCGATSNQYASGS